MPRFGFAYRPFGNDKWAIRGGVGHLQHQHAGFELLLADRHGAGIYAATSPTPTTPPPTRSATSGRRSMQASRRQRLHRRYGTDYFGTANSTNWKDPYTEQWSLERGSRFRAPATRHASPISARRRINWSGRRTKTRCPTPPRCRHSTSPSARACSPTGAASTRAPRAPMRATTRCSWRPAIGCNRGSNTTPDLPGPRPSRTTKALRLSCHGDGFAGEGGGERVDLGPRPACGLRQCLWNPQTALEHDGAVRSAVWPRQACWAASMPRVADLVVGGWRLSSILTVQTGPYETPYFPSGEGDPRAPARA